MILKISKLHRIYLINIAAEFSGSVLYSFLYFISIGRYLSTQFDVNLLTTGLTIGFAYFMAVYIPFHTNRIHLIPFVSIIRALQKKKLAHHLAIAVNPGLQEELMVFIGWN